jgi:RNA polymerase sigma-70 factor (ECF subfamily)
VSFFMRSVTRFMSDNRQRPAATAAADFERLLRPHVAALYRYAYRWTAAQDRAEDLVQEVLTRVYPRCAELGQLDQIRPWLLRVMYRIFVDELRRERRSPVRSTSDVFATGEAEADGFEYGVAPGPEPAEEAERELTQRRLLAAWERLADDHRVVLSLHDIEGYSLTELAPLLDVPVGTLKSRLHRARARMRELLAVEPFELPARVCR